MCFFSYLLCVMRGSIGFLIVAQKKMCRESPVVVRGTAAAHAASSVDEAAVLWLNFLLLSYASRIFQFLQLRFLHAASHRSYCDCHRLDDAVTMPAFDPIDQSEGHDDHVKDVKGARQVAESALDTWFSPVGEVIRVVLAC